MIGERYVVDTLKEHFMLYVPFIEPNAQPHVANCVAEYLSYANIDKFWWPAFKRRVRTQFSNPTPSNLRELEEAVLEEWEII